MWNAWLRCWQRLTGRHCCTEFTQWETYKGEFSRIPSSLTERIKAGSVDRIGYTKRWQERRCTICGKMQQRELRW